MSGTVDQVSARLSDNVQYVGGHVAFYPLYNPL